MHLVLTEIRSDVTSAELVSTSCVSTARSASRCDMSACVVHTHTHRHTDSGHTMITLKLKLSKV